jgi:hypothetical protein
MSMLRIELSPAAASLVTLSRAFYRAMSPKNKLIL